MSIEIERVAWTNTLDDILTANGFTKWLLTRIDRNDRIGDLARDVAMDEEWPYHFGCGMVEMAVYLNGHVNACDDAIKTFEIAYKEYSRWSPIYDSVAEDE